ncbi:hypothetical protein lerEdw1_000010 [Lerista edwardsae]|nr:hypothetical protein lerEdw1_000010 [Lerista edwardsae]
MRRREKQARRWSLPRFPPFLTLLLAPLLLCHSAEGVKRRATNLQLNVCATCHADATCHQNDGKDSCICNYGFMGNGITHCQDKDECYIGQDLSKICGEHALCHNTHGSFYCTCHDGYQASSKNKIFIPNDGTLCADIDECKVSDICGLGGRCVNTDGSHECYCTEGYRPENGTEPFHPPTDGLSCKVVDCGVPPSLPHAYIASVNKTTYGSKVVYSCWPGYVMERGIQIAVCNSRGEWEGAFLLCKEIDCGKPPYLPNTHITWDNSTTLGSRIYYTCREGFQSVGGSNFSQCSITQKWENTTFECKEINCGKPPLIPHSSMTWDNTSQLGSVVKYKCIEDFIATNVKSISRCTSNGSWEILDLRCEKVKSFIGVAFKNSCLTWRRRNGQATVNETYRLTMRMLGSKSEKMTDELKINFKTPEENVTVCLPIRKGANYSAIVKEESTNMLLQVSITHPVLVEKEVVFGNTSIYNNTCVKWQKKSKRKQSEETYIFHIQGQRWYQKQFHHKTILNFTTDSQTPEFCLNLPPGSNFSVNISTANLDHTVLVYMTTPISEPQSPEVEFISVRGSVPFFTLKKAEEINGPIRLLDFILCSTAPQESLLVLSELLRLFSFKSISV